MAKASALLVGLKSVDPACYDGWDGTGGCWGCELDVDNIARILEPLGYQIQTLKTMEATRDAILSSLYRAAENRVKGDIFVFYYSGHGGQQPDPDGDEVDGKDETLVAYCRQIIDDDIHKALTKFKSGVYIIMLSDSCNSGTNYRLRMTVPVNEEAIFRPMGRKGQKAIDMKAQLIHLGGCRDGFGSAGYQEGGDFTMALCNAWGDGAFQGTLGDLHSTICELIKSGQKPQYNEYGPVSDDFRNQRTFVVPTITSNGDFVELKVVETAATAAQISLPGEKHTYKFTAVKACQYTIETEGRTDLMISLYGPDSQTKLIDRDDDSGSGLNAKIVADLTPATYYVQAQHYNSHSGTGSYSIKVSI
ncbi:MAG: caspase family protein [Candidatus Methanomarinus sp.]|uniref:Caspase family protein n=1 Tax=Candidatus Methanomarinus sp. TaxID=3386244 RepID=A0AC61SAG1_9EURY|nr:MAG: Caspase domain-containing protein [ANME-2 cluster archaeon]KAF5428828.1 Caspase domain-containing protein [ANME-2 cluster archaeon]TKY91507.1 MAG: caspase family protein [ANME-2 cluster archaeon]